MEDNQIAQVVETNRKTLARLVNVSMVPDASTVTICKGKIRRNVLITLSYIVMIISLLFFGVSFQIEWRMAPIWFILILWCIYIIREESKTVIVDMKLGTVSIGGKWQKNHTYAWSDYQGYEISRSVMDIPEEFYIKFQDKDNVKKIKLTNLTPLFKKHLQADDEAMTAVWKCIEDGMRNSSGKSLTL